MNVYCELTKEFNRGDFRAILSSGQAVVMHKLAIMSKDGDWILKESEEVTAHVLDVLEGHGAKYRFGAPLDCRWMGGGWSSHFEFRRGPLRVRTDFVTRPPRISYETVRGMFDNSEPGVVPVVDIKNLAELKKTNREKDYAVIGELSRRLKDPEDALLLSRSARDILDMASRFPDLIAKLQPLRPVLQEVAHGVEAVEVALDAERRQLIHANERRLQCYLDAAEDWTALWPDLAARIKDLPLNEAHAILVERAQGILPVQPWGGE